MAGCVGVLKEQLQTIVPVGSIGSSGIERQVYGARRFPGDTRGRQPDLLDQGH